MGLNNENATRLIFDIETAPLPDASEYLEAADAPANYKDATKIAEYIAAKNAENLDRCGLDVDLCRVVAIGMWQEGGEIVVCNGGEAGMLTAFWAQAAVSHLVGFNCLAFDLPVLMRRSQYLGVAVPSIAIDKYRHPSVTDLQQVLSFNGAIRLRGLSFYAKRFGLDIEDEYTGADIARLFAEGNWDAIQQHVSRDVEKTGRLAARLGYFSVPALADAVA